MTSPAAASGTLTLPPGTVVGGRFVVEAEVRTDALGVVLRARDDKTKKAIALRILRPDLLNPNAVTALRHECRTIAGLSHPGLLATFGVGSAPNGAPFVAGEWFDGQPLPDAIAARKGQGPIPLPAIYRVISAVSSALGPVHAKTSHGSLRPSAVLLSERGRIKVSDLAVGKTIVAHAGIAVLGRGEEAFIAPEVRAKRPATPTSDVFGLGTVLYLLLTGRSAAEKFVPPSSARPDATKAIDEVLLRALAKDPDQRFRFPVDLRDALASALGIDPVASDAVDIDIDLDAGGPAPVPAHAVAPPHVAAPPVPSELRAGSRVSIVEEFRPSLAEVASVGGSSGEVDLRAVLTKITENDAARWMLSKDRLDHGPFSGKELVDLIASGEALEEHVALNMDTGERRPLAQWHDFRGFLEEAKAHRAVQAHEKALAHAEQSEKRSGFAKLLIASAILAALVLVGVGFLLTRGSRGRDEVAEAGLDGLYRVGEIEITGTAGILPDPPRGGGGGGRRHGGGGRPGGGGMTYEDAMNQAVEMGNLNQAGGERRLSPAEVAGVMNRHVNRIYGACVVPAARSGERLGEVTIDLAIAGNGQVLGASARPGSGSFQACINRAVASVRFPTFPAPRMGARYRFSVD